MLIQKINCLCFSAHRATGLWNPVAVVGNKKKWSRNAPTLLDWIKQKLEESSCSLCCKKILGAVFQCSSLRKRLQYYFGQMKIKFRIKVPCKTKHFWYLTDIFRITSF